MSKVEISTDAPWEVPLLTDGYFSGADELLEWAEEMDALEVPSRDAGTSTATTSSDASVDLDYVVANRKRPAADLETEREQKDPKDQVSSSLGHLNLNSQEAKRLKRVMANRASAKRSRLRRLREQEKAAKEAEELRGRHTQLQASFKAVCAENKLLREQVAFLQSLLRRNNSTEALSLSTIAILNGKKSPPLIPMTMDQVSSATGEVARCNAGGGTQVLEAGKGAVLLAVFCCFSFNGVWIPSSTGRDVLDEAEQGGITLSLRVLEMAAAYLLIGAVLCLNWKKLWGVWRLSC